MVHAYKFYLTCKTIFIYTHMLQFLTFLRYIARYITILIRYIESDIAHVVWDHTHNVLFNDDSTPFIYGYMASDIW